MPSRKQRRRRQKDRRHEWEYVYVDETGEEVVREAPAVEKTPSGSRDGKAERKAKSTPAAKGRPKTPLRQVHPPSWRRVAKRGLIFAPFMYLTLTFIGGDLDTTGRIINTVVLLAFFLPFSYVMDTVMYRSFRKRGGEPAPGSLKRRR